MYRPVNMRAVDVNVTEEVPLKTQLQTEEGIGYRVTWDGVSFCPA